MIRSRSVVESQTWPEPRGAMLIWCGYEFYVETEELVGTKQQELVREGVGIQSEGMQEVNRWACVEPEQE